MINNLRGLQRKMSIDSNALTVVVKSRNSSIQKEENEAVLRNKSRKTKEKE